MQRVKLTILQKWTYTHKLSQSIHLIRSQSHCYLFRVTIMLLFIHKDLFVKLLFNRVSNRATQNITSKILRFSMPNYSKLRRILQPAPSPLIFQHWRFRIIKDPSCRYFRSSHSNQLMLVLWSALTLPISTITRW